METGAIRNNMKTAILILATMLESLLASRADAQVFHLKLFDNTCRIAECLHTRQGTRVIGDPLKATAFNDRFTIDFDQRVFTWEGKGRYEDEIRGHKTAHNRHTFRTRRLSATLTTNGNRAVLQLIFFYRERWIQATYFCRT